MFKADEISHKTDGKARKWAGGGWVSNKKTNADIKRLWGKMDKRPGHPNMVVISKGLTPAEYREACRQQDKIACKIKRVVAEWKAQDRRIKRNSNKTGRPVARRKAK